MYAKRPGQQPRLDGLPPIRAPRFPEPVTMTHRAGVLYAPLARRRRPNSQYAAEPLVLSALATRQRFLGPRT